MFVCTSLNPESHVGPNGTRVLSQSGPKGLRSKGRVPSTLVRDIAKRRIKELLEQRISLQQLITESIRQVSSEQCQGFNRGVKHALASCFEGRPLAMNSSSTEYSLDGQPLQYVDEQDQSSPNEDATDSEEQAQV